jgi:hypothetical protein
MAGTTDKARQFYGNVFHEHADFLETVAGKKQESIQALRKRCENLRLRLVAPDSDETAFQEIAAVLMAAACHKPTDRPALDHLLKGLDVLSHRKALMDQMNGDQLLAQFVLGFLRQTDDPATMPRRLQLAEQMELRKAAGWALAVANDRKASGRARGAALLLLGKVGDKKHIGKIEPLLKDTTAVGSRKLGRSVLQTELRDVALATSAKLKGIDPATLGFPYLAVIPGIKTLPDPACLGFATKADRAKAFAAWEKKKGQ